jgi:hypothetical protein
MSIALDVIERINQVTGVDITKKTRNRNVVELRIIYAQIMLKNTDFTTGKTARYINKDHATILHYRKQFDNLFIYQDFKNLYIKIISGFEICNKTKSERLEELGWININPLLINDILKIYA